MAPFPADDDDDFEDLVVVRKNAKLPEKPVNKDVPSARVEKPRPGAGNAGHGNSGDPVAQAPKDLKQDRANRQGAESKGIVDSRNDVSDVILVVPDEKPSSKNTAGLITSPKLSSRESSKVLSVVECTIPVEAVPLQSMRTSAANTSSIPSIENPKTPNMDLPKGSDPKRQHSHSTRKTSSIVTGMPVSSPSRGGDGNTSTGLTLTHIISKVTDRCLAVCRARFRCIDVIYSSMGCLQTKTRWLMLPGVNHLRYQFRPLWTRRERRIPRQRRRR
eukprot:GHVU01148470.1.p1 GENE.GHVU01148470.1~~GHVU01148470.1.p1  ORF type:complete len:274 (+),score=16.83 GHVU01148470.1:413-1234(+)